MLANHQPLPRANNQDFCTREELCAYFFIAAHWFTLQLGISWARGVSGRFEWTLTLLLLLAVFLWKQPGTLLSITLIFPAYMLYQAPEVPNHRWLLTLLDISCAFFFIKAWRTKTLPFDKSNFQGWQWILAVIYLYAVLAKLNSGFFGATSCAGKFFDNVTLLWFNQTISISPFWVAFATVITEATLLALAIYHQQRYAIYLCLGGVALHLGLAFDLYKWFLNFSSVMFWLYIGILMCFIPDGSRSKSALPGKLCYYFIALLLTSFYFHPSPSPNFSRFNFFAAWLATYSILFYSCALIIKANGLTPAIFRKPSPIVLTVALIALLNGSGPYLGFKTRTSFNMYSNLHLTPTSSNHFLFPSSPDIFGYLGDEIKIVDSPLQSLPTNTQMPYFEFYRKFCHYPATLTYQHHAPVPDTWYPSTTITTCQELQKPRFFDVLRKILVFRPSHKGVTEQCIW